MKNLGFTSPYARVGLFFCVLTTIIGGYLAGRQPDVAFATTQHTYAQLPSDFEELFSAPKDHGKRQALNYLEAVSSEPCFAVTIDAALLDEVELNRTDLFRGGEIAASQDLLVSELKHELVEAFSDKVWRDDPNCFNGSFVVSFGVEEDGSLGANMLVHHVRGGSNMAGVSVLNVLLRMNEEGHRWHDGTQGAGEVRIPVSFKLI